MRLEWGDAALADFADILTHLPPEVAANTVSRVIETEHHILLFPKAAYYDAATDTFERYVPKTRVILIYHIADDVIEIISAFHTLRDPETKHKR